MVAPLPSSCTPAGVQQPPKLGFPEGGRSALTRGDRAQPNVAGGSA